MHRPVPCRRRFDVLTHCEAGRAAPPSHDNGRLQPGRTVPQGLSTFPHPRASTAIQWLACGSSKVVHRSVHRPLRCWPGADRGKLSRWSWDRCERGGLMARGLGRIPLIRGTLTQAREEPGNGMSAGRYTPRTDYPAKGTGGKGTEEGSPPGRRSPGMAPDVMGWPWHPRRLATARRRGDGAA